MKLWIVSLVTVLGLSLLGYLPVYSTSMLSMVERDLDIPVVEPVRVETAPLQVPVYHSPAVTLGDAGEYAPPDFRAYKDSGARKQAFYDYLLPKIHKANRQVQRERQWLLMLRQKVLQDQVLTTQELEELTTYETRYDIDGNGSIASRVGKLLNRVDVVPASLVVAQAAKESGWGTSRFARQANNFFGIWCFYEGCGIKPSRREEGRTHEVATFRTVEEGTRYYVRTINTHWAYADLRGLRAVARRQNQSFGGERLAVGLVRYSERGTDYVEEIQSMIRVNRLHRFTRADEWVQRPDSV
ncbi:MAG: glucosaminidase domain-containing protein [Pseudomonadales bacterium]